ncbi:Dps family protein [Limimaricola litoreus]|uniref:DNA starvation/stationary phase protection protein n=1 Tax=Limimaricola litoreus TaxID=2955316 RepID=A0A9X2FRY1_9RHOB|nr:DNA starvation/stationary phase protection protein [Limimaricola litoreus]MCP1169520.1 DNA starvation/stationary phase protection protein [Limimaricola litoreus]
MTITMKHGRYSEDAKPVDRNAVAIADALSDALTDTYRLVLKTHACHWNVVGAMFYPLHQMTEEHYTDMFTAADVLAERIRALGKRASVKPVRMIDGLDTGADLTADEMVRGLLSDHEALSRRFYALVEAAEISGDPVTADLATERAAFHDKAAWMLRATAA